MSILRRLYPLLLTLLLIFVSLLIVINADGYQNNETRPYVPQLMRKDQQRVDLCPLTKWKQGQTSVTLTTLIPSFLLLFSLFLLSVTPLTRFSLLSLANSSPRDRVIDKCATITSTRTNTPAWITEQTDTTQEDAQKSQTGTEDWQTGRKSETLQWLPVTAFDWQLVDPSHFSSMRSLIKKQWQTTSGQKAIERSSVKSWWWFCAFVRLTVTFRCQVYRLANLTDGHADGS